MGTAADPSDLDDLRAAVREVVADRASSSELHRFVDGDASFDRPLWALAAELGWLGLAIPEAHGGLSLGVSETAVVCEELGRALAPIPYVATLLGARALALGASEAQQAAWLPGIAAGQRVVALAADLEGAGCGVRLSGGAGDVVLDGVSADVLDAPAADLVVVHALDDEGLDAWVVVETDARGVTLAAEPLWDRTHSLASLRFEAVSLPAERVLAGGSAPGIPTPGSLHRTLCAEAALALACDAVGGAAAIFEKVLDYLKTRQQFGKPIGSFQALKHRCADHKVAIEASAALVRDAVARHAAGAADTLMTTLLAKAYACEVYAGVAEDAVQLHGGIGFTWEHVCHLYLKRAKLDQALLGGPGGLYDRAAALLRAA